MWLRKGDSEKILPGKVIWIIGRRDSGKTTLIDALQKAGVPNLVACDDFLRCRAGIQGKDDQAYNKMIGLGYALAYQGFDCLMPAGCRSRRLRDRIRSEIPSSIFVYLDGRGRECSDYEPPTPDEHILTLPAHLSIQEEVELCLKKIWKQSAKSS